MKYLGLVLSKFIKLIYIKLDFDFKIRNNIGDIGAKYIGLALSKLFKLTNLILIINSY